MELNEHEHEHEHEHEQNGNDSESEDRYRTLMDALPHLMWTADPLGNITYTNKRCVEFTGHDSKIKYGQGWTKLMHPDDLQLVGASWVRSMKSGQPFAEEYRMLGADNHYHWFLGRAVAIKDFSGKIEYWIGSATDIDVQKQSIENLENERILRERFVATISHDLKNPLTAAKTAAHMMGRCRDSPDRLLSLSGRIVDNLNRAAQMIDNLLDANRIKAGFALELNLEDMELCEVVTETLNDLISIHGDRFILKSTDKVIYGYWSVDAIRRVVENLCTNAIKYGSKQDKITVRIKKEEGDIYISVHNFGNPMNKEESEDLFAPFKRSTLNNNMDSPGWGLGLTIVKGISEALGGSISMKSSVEDGTTFTFQIPYNHRIN